MLFSHDVHGNKFPEKQLEEIEIFFKEGNAVPITSLTLPSGKWVDLERIEITAGFTNIPDSVNTTIVHRKDLIASPTGWSARVRLSSGVMYEVGITANSSNTATILNTGAGVGLKSVIGYKKRYAVENNSVIIPVNGGLNVAVNSRYEVDLPPEFYEADGSVKKGVQVRAELNLSGVNFTGWAESVAGHMYNSTVSAHYHYGMRAYVLDNKVVVDVGGFGTSSPLQYKYIVYNAQANPWGVTTSILAAPCRVIVTLNDAYQIQKYELHSMSADAELEGVVLYDGERVANGGDVPLSEDILANEYKEIRVYGAFTYPSVAEYSDVLILSPEELLSNYRHEVLGRTDAGSSTAAAAIYIDGELSTGTSLRVSASNSFFTSAGVHKVVGYKKRYTSQNQSVVIPVNGGANVGINQRYVMQLPPQFYGLDGNIKSGVQVRAEVYNDGSVGGDIGWGDSGWTSVYVGSTDRRGAGVKASVLGSSVVVQTGTHYLLLESARQGSPFGIPNTGNTVSAPCRIVATLNDAIAVKSQGYGSLVTDDAITSVTPQDLSGVGATPTVIEFHISGEDNGDVPMNVVESTANNSLTLNVVGRWMPDLALELVTDSANTERVIRVELYNVTDDLVVKSKPHSIIKNQTKHLIDFDRVFRLATEGKEFQIRMYIESGSFSKLDVVHADWTVDLI